MTPTNGPNGKRRLPENEQGSELIPGIGKLSPFPTDKVDLDLDATSDAIIENEESAEAVAHKKANLAELRQVCRTNEEFATALRGIAEAAGIQPVMKS